MMTGKMYGRFVTIGLALLSLSCASVPRGENISSYEGTVRKLVSQLVRNPDDAEAHRDLGIIYFQTQQFAQSERHLSDAVRADSSDGKALFYYGLSLEFQNKRDAAMGVYLNYDRAPLLSPYRSLMQGRYGRLTRELISQELKSLLAQEQLLSDAGMSPTTLAVYPLVYRGSDKKYAALGRGLSEMILIDLAQVRSLKLVERIRIEALTAELRLGQSSVVDATTAPRLGRLLKAGRILTGTYTVTDRNALRLDVGLWHVAKKEYPKGIAKSDDLDNLFMMEKEVVFGILERMGVRLTPLERQKIQYVPTRNIQSFMSYCIGLEREDVHDFGGAAAYFTQAATLDPNFSLAQQKKGEMQAIAVGGGTASEAYAAAQSFDPSIPSDRSDMLVGRLRMLQFNVESGFFPGEDSRKPAEESFGSGAAFGPLPGPPTPPGNL